jgi:ABC-2 type transport system permease protein
MTAAPGTVAAPAARTPRRAARAPWLRVAVYAARRRRFAPLAWGVPLGLLSVMVVAIFPTIEGTPELDDLVEAYPEALKEAFGISDTSFRTIAGYLDAEVFSLIAPLATSYFVIHALAALVGGERGILDVLLSAPLRRRELLAGWFAGTAAVLAAIVVVLGTLIQLGALVAGVDLAVADTAAAVANLWPLSVFFGGVTVLICGFTQRAGAITGSAAGIAVLMYLLEVLGKLSSSLAGPAELSAFHYYGSALQDGIDPGHALLLTGAGFVLAAVGAALFERRDVAG